MGPSITPIVRNLLIINLIAFAIQAIGQVNLPLLFGLRYFESIYFQPWQILTYMFIHSNLSHLFGNMLGLFFFGPLLETTMGSRRFLTFYMICGMGAGILNYGVMFGELQFQKQAIYAYEKNPDGDAFIHYMAYYEKDIYDKNYEEINSSIEKNQFNPKEGTDIIKKLYDQKVNRPYYLVVGASGAIFGIMMGIFLLFPNIEIMLLIFPVPIKAKYLISVYLLYELFAGVNYSEVSNVAHFAHLGGALIAFLLIKFWGIRRQY